MAAIPSMKLAFGSFCSGIEGASVAFAPLGWKARFVSEIDPICCKIISHHYKDVPNYGDLTKVSDPAQVDVVIGGTPCQSFSVTGLRKGLDDPRGQLSQGFCRILADTRPRWFIWENVTGALRTECGKGFGALLGALVDCGYRCAWRVLDAIGFGVAQRRQRVFVVGHFGDWRRSAAVLFDRPSGQANARATTQIRKERHASNGHARTACFGWTGDETPKFQPEATPTLRAGQGGEGVGVISNSLMRQLTPVEWERLQGFPDGYTAVDGVSERQRMRVLGNSFAVPVVRWIGRRIMEVESWQ